MDSVELVVDPTDEEISTALDSVCLDATLRGSASHRVIGNNIGHHLFQYMSKMQTELYENTAKTDRLDKTVQGLQAENRRLRSLKQSSQAVRSRLFENYRKATSLGSHDRTQPSKVVIAWPTAAVSTKIGSCTRMGFGVITMFS